jgi:hypothetical protein
MIRRSFFSLLGMILIAASIAGIAISVVGVMGVWQIEKNIKASLDNTLALLDTTLQTTFEGLTIASQSLEQANTSLATLSKTIETTGKSVSDSIPLLESLTQVTVVDLPTTISTTQAALQSAQMSARVVDSTLTALTSIPFLFAKPYDNSKPLSKALEDVSDSLDPIPTSLLSMESSLAASKENLGTMEVMFTQIAADIDTINTSTASAQGVVAQYLELIETLRAQLAQARVQLPAALDQVAWFITVAFVWLGITQIGLMMQGLEMMGLSFERKVKGKIEPVHLPAG